MFFLFFSLWSWCVVFMVIRVVSFFYGFVGSLVWYRLGGWELVGILV